MKKLLYITDQDEYSSHNFIAPLFERYMKEHMFVDIVYFSDFKSDFERQDTHRFIVPSRYKNVLLSELSSHDVDLASYDFVLVRNDIKIMQQVLKEKGSYGYKTAFRFSFPKKVIKMRYDKLHKKSHFIHTLTHTFASKNKSKIINTCDFFLPTSQKMKEEFFPNVKTKTILCPPGIDPEILHPNVQHEDDEKRFCYEGTFDKTREFETVLDAFGQVKSPKWKLIIATKEPKQAQALVARYPVLQNKIDIRTAKNKEELLDIIAHADIGLALLPDIPIYNTSTPVKTLDYYASAVPSLMTEGPHVSEIFTEGKEAWFSAFEVDKIQEKLEALMALSKEEVAAIGLKGQAKLLEVKNYKTIAKNLALELQA